MFVCDTNNLFDIKAANVAYLSELIGICDVYRTKSILYNFRHLGSLNICKRNFNTRSSVIQISNPLGNSRVVRSNRTVVMKKLINHVARNDPLGSMRQSNVIPPCLNKDGAYKMIDRSRGNR